MNGHLNAALILIDRALEEIENGFVACPVCGWQEDTKNLDFVDDLKDAKAELVKLVEEEQSRTEYKSPNDLVMDSENMLSLIDQAVTSLDCHPVIDETFLAGKVGNKQIQVTVTQDEDEFIYSEGDHYVLPIEKKA